MSSSVCSTRFHTPSLFTEALQYDWEDSPVVISNCSLQIQSWDPWNTYSVARYRMTLESITQLVITALALIQSYHLVIQLHTVRTRMTTQVHGRSLRPVASATSFPSCLCSASPKRPLIVSPNHFRHRSIYAPGPWHVSERGPATSASRKS